MNEEPLRIICLEAENVKRLKAVRIRPDKTLVRIEGRNGAGKTSVLDAIAAALGGGKWQPDKPVRKGEKKASVKLDLGELMVERRWTAKGGTMLEVTSNGTRMATPQTILDKLVGDLTFDPLAFVRMAPKDQADTLRRLAGLDFDKLDAERAALYDERTLANREYKRYEAGREAMPAKPASMKPIDVRALAAKHEEAAANNREAENLAMAYGRAVESVADLKGQMETLVLRLETADKLATASKQASDGIERIDVSDLGAEIAKAEQRNKAIEVYERWQEHEADVKAAGKYADSFTDKIEAIDADKARQLAAAKFPLDGLGIDANGPTLNDIPFSQASSAEQLRTSVAIGLAEKRRARIMLIRDGSLLDGDGLKDLNRIAEEFDAQVFVERVAESAAPSAVYIEDGEIMEAAE